MKAARMMLFQRGELAEADGCRSKCSLQDGSRGNGGAERQKSAIKATEGRVKGRECD